MHTRISQVRHKPATFSRLHRAGAVAVHVPHHTNLEAQTALLQHSRERTTAKPAHLLVHFMREAGHHLGRHARHTRRLGLRRRRHLCRWGW